MPSSKRANKALRTLRPQLGRVIRDIRCKIAGDGALEGAFETQLSLAGRVLTQRQRQRGPKVYSLHAPEVQGIGKGRAHKPYEFDVKASVATPINPARAASSSPISKFCRVCPMTAISSPGCFQSSKARLASALQRIIADAGYRGRNAIPRHKLKVYTSGQKRGVTLSVKRDLRRRAAVEPVIGHLKAEHRMARSYLAYRPGDVNNAVLAAVGYNFRLLLNWLRLLWLQIWIAAVC